MDLLSDVITYVRRIVKTPTNASLSDNLIVDYINRFWIMDVDARVQLFDLKTKYQFETIPGISDYNMPLYSAQGSTVQSTISPLPVYQGFSMPCYANGIEVPFYNSRDSFWKIWPNYLQALTPVAYGDGSTTTFQFSLPFFPAIPGHLDMTGIIANYNATSGTLQDPIFANSFTLTGNYINLPSTSFYPGVFITYTNANGSNTLITDSGVFLQSGTAQQLYGLLVQPGQPPTGTLPLGGNSYSTTQNTVNYQTGVVNVTFPTPPGEDVPIQVQSYFYQQGLPRAIMYWNNILTIRPSPDVQYLIELDAYLTPAAFLSSTQALQFAYMAEYIARGAAQKILSDTGDLEQYAFYEPIFKKQELLVWVRSQRIWTATRTGTIFSDLQGPQSNLNGVGQGAT